MKRLLITGADGFVGKWLIREARAQGFQVVAAILPDNPTPPEWGDAVEIVRADLRDVEKLAPLADANPDAVVHLAAIASGAEARKNPEAARDVNGVGTAMLASEFLDRGHHPTFLFVSTAEIYGGEHAGPIPETAAIAPSGHSPYAVYKAAAEGALRTLTELPVVVARAFPHTGPGQSPTYVVPALAQRLREAKASPAAQRGIKVSVKTGNLTVVRDFLDVRDVVRAYLLLLEKGTPGEVYNVASGVGYKLADVFQRLARIVGVVAHAEQDASLLRTGDIPALIGDPAKLKAATGWSPQITFDRTLQDLVDAQAH